MKKTTLFTLALTGALLVAAPVAFAATSDSADAIQSDNAAVSKDNTAIKHDHSNMATNRANKARHKANGDLGAQAADSAKLGANHLAVGEKKTEKSVDKGIQQNDVEDAQ